MGATKFTPGPWYAMAGQGPISDQAAVFDEGDDLIADCRPIDDDVRSVEENQANARLIAAAPDLYAALEGVIAVADRRTVEFDAARAALAKARGE